jgi:hypothetical protein
MPDRQDVEKQENIKVTVVIGYDNKLVQACQMILAGHIDTKHHLQDRPQDKQTDGPKR